MAVALGTNSGFVSAAPSADPATTDGQVGAYAIAQKDTSPAGTNKVTALGWYQANAGNSESDYSCGIYSHDAGNDRPNALIATQSSGQSVPVNTEEWLSYTGLNISLTASTTYWIAATAEDVASDCKTDYSTTGDMDYKSGGPPLPSPWGSSSGSLDRVYSIYALYEAAVGAVAPTGVFYGPLVGPMGGPI